MKIRKVMDKKVGAVTYFKYLITLPKEEVEKSGLFEQYLKVKGEKGKIIIEKL